MNGELPYREIDEFVAELKAAAFESLLLNPGSEFGDWQQDLICNYPAEVADALGNDPQEVMAALGDMWTDEYEDPATGICQSFKTWAECFTTRASVDMYYRLVQATRMIRKLNEN